MGSEQLQRVLTGLVLIPLVLSLVVFAPLKLFAIVTALVALLTLREYLDLAELLHLAPLRYPAYVFGGLLVVGPAILPVGPSSPMLEGLLVLLALALAMRPGRDLAQSLGAAASTVMGVLYVALPFALLVFLREAPKGEYLVVYVLALTWVSDTAAYYAGRAFGRHKMALRVSPGKTWEGAAASLAAATLFGWLFLGYFFPAVPLWASLLSALAVNIAGQVGDLAESALKRGAGVKDSGSLLPGHGGLLDRVDALLFAIPVLWYDIQLLLAQYLV